MKSAGYSESLARVFRKNYDGYSHYAKNLSCEMDDLFALGPAAHGRYGDRAALNTNDLKTYYALVGQGKLPITGGRKLTRTDLLHRHLALPIKCVGHIDKTLYQKRTGASLNDVFRAKIGNLKKHGLITEDDECLELTEMGRFFADEVATQFLPQRYQSFPRTAYADGPLNPFVDAEPLV